MPRQMRIDFPGAIHHVMSRGDRRENIYLDDVDRQDFLKTLAEACQKTDVAFRAFHGTFFQMDSGDNGDFYRGASSRLWRGWVWRFLPSAPGTFWQDEVVGFSQFTAVSL
jgi:hypothetical protein